MKLSFLFTYILQFSHTQIIFIEFNKKWEEIANVPAMATSLILLLLYLMIITEYYKNMHKNKKQSMRELSSSSSVFLETVKQRNYFKSISEFHIYEEPKIGNGSFGSVCLGMHIRTNKLYAIKIVRCPVFRSKSRRP